MNKAAFPATLAAASLLGVVLAYWSWAFFAPAPAPRAAAAAAEIRASASSAHGLFGNAQQSQSAGAIRLTGVLAVSGGSSGSQRGHALLRLDGKRTLAVLQGDDVEPGLRLAEVHADHVVLERNGARETLAWPEKAGK